MDKANQDQERETKAAEGKKEYSAPKLTEYGSLRELTMRDLPPGFDPLSIY